MTDDQAQGEQQARDGEETKVRAGVIQHLAMRIAEQSVQIAELETRYQQVAAKLVVAEGKLAARDAADAEPAEAP